MLFAGNSLSGVILIGLTGELYTVEHGLSVGLLPCLPFIANHPRSLMDVLWKAPLRLAMMALAHSSLKRRLANTCPARCTLILSPT